MSDQPRKGLRKALWTDRALDNQSNDLRGMFARVPDTEFKKFAGLYQQGIVLRTKGPPLAVECIRCRDPRVPTSTVAHGSAVSFDLKDDGVTITRIDGLTFGTQFLEIIFRITYGDV